MPDWIDTHCHLDAPEFDADRDAVVARAARAGVAMVLPGVVSEGHAPLQALARRTGQAYALGVHPLWIDREPAGTAERLARALADAQGDPHLVAVGEIGLDGFVAGLDPDRQRRLLADQLAIARDAGLPVILHVRRAADLVLSHLRRIRVAGGIAHAFNGSPAQARAFLDLGLKLGFGGAMTFERALQIRRLAATLPDDAIVLETDAPDIPPHWLYRTAAERAAGQVSRNEPAELPRIARTLAALRDRPLDEIARLTRANAHAALPRLAALGAGAAGAGT